MPGHQGKAIDVIAVVGTCSVERRSCARRCAVDRGFVFVPTEQTSQGVAAVDRVIGLVSSAVGAPGIVLEYAADVPMVEIVGALSAEGTGIRLVGIVCVIDARALLSDVTGSSVDRERMSGPDGRGGVVDDAASTQAEILVSQIEFSSMIELCHLDEMGEAELESVLGLLAHLAPEAMIGPGDCSSGSWSPRIASLPQSWPLSAGWVAVLNREFSPCFHAPGLSVCRYEQVRPFHPQRLCTAITESLASGACGRIIRSAGFARLASCSDVTAQWDQVAESFSLTPICVDADLDRREGMLAVGQDIVFFGFQLDSAALRRALNAATLRDEEFLAGPVVWSTFDDAGPVQWR